MSKETDHTLSRVDRDSQILPMPPDRTVAFRGYERPIFSTAAGLRVVFGNEEAIDPDLAIELTEIE